MRDSYLELEKQWRGLAAQECFTRRGSLPRRRMVRRSRDSRGSARVAGIRARPRLPDPKTVVKSEIVKLAIS